MAELRANRYSAYGRLGTPSTATPSKTATSAGRVLEPVHQRLTECQIGKEREYGLSNHEQTSPTLPLLDFARLRASKSECENASE